jgi:hypothetical protein
MHPSLRDQLVAHMGLPGDLLSTRIMPALVKAAKTKRSGHEFIFNDQFDGPVDQAELQVAAATLDLGKVDVYLSYLGDECEVPTMSVEWAPEFDHDAAPSLGLEERALARTIFSEGDTLARHVTEAWIAGCDNHPAYDLDALIFGGKLLQAIMATNPR